MNAQSNTAKKPAPKAAKKKAAKKGNAETKVVPLAPKPSAPAPKWDGRTNPLASAAMLICVEVHMWGNRTLDRKISDEVADERGAATDMLRTWKRLIGKEAMKKVTVPFSRYKAHHYINTVPWLDNGYRMLPSSNYLAYVAEERKLRATCMAAVDDFLKEYPKYRDMAKKQLGSAFSEEDYPEPALLKNKWRIDIHFMPVPDKADFRVDVPATELARINADIDGQVKAALENAHRDLFERLYRVVVGLRDKLKKYRVVKEGKKQKVEGAFRESAVGNIIELCDLLPRLNVMNNPELAKLAEKVKASFGSFSADELKDDEAKRDETIKKADAILAQMADYITE
jgi:hypothetical protein